MNDACYCSGEPCREFPCRSIPHPRDHAEAEAEYHVNRPLNERVRERLAAVICPEHLNARFAIADECAALVAHRASLEQSLAIADAALIKLSAEYSALEKGRDEWRQKWEQACTDINDRNGKIAALRRVIESVPPPRGCRWCADNPAALLDVDGTFSSVSGKPGRWGHAHDDAYWFCEDAAALEGGK